LDVVLGSFGPDGMIPDRDPLALTAEGDGWYSGFAQEAVAGDLYTLRLDGGAAYPDPASRFQPFGPHGPSQIIDPASFAWSDAGWSGLRLEGMVLYELHIGTFTHEGTWWAAALRLGELAELGINALEVMPVAEFAGRHGWGYDGVDLFAPYHEYGTPDDMRRFVARAHHLGIGVILDVNYNHFGPDGAHHRQFADAYFHPSRAANEWGEALNFDGPGCEPVREFFKANAGYWIDEFHLDGLRLDATQAIQDDSPEHIIAAIARCARKAAGNRPIVLIGENEPQEVSQIEPIERGGHGLDALWNDDFHHAAIVALTGRAEAYYRDYAGTPQELISAVRWGYLFQGQFSHWQQRPRGTPVPHVTAARFINYLENHDQVANTALGRRLAGIADAAALRALIALWLLAPQTPMLFQGQESGSTGPFHYFGDFPGETGRKMAQGRRDQESQFPSMTSPDASTWVPDPMARETFLASKLTDDRQPGARLMRSLFGDLIRLRRDDPIFRAQRADRIHGAVIGPHALALRYQGEGNDCRLVVTNLGRDRYNAIGVEPLMAPPSGTAWRLLLASEHPRYGGRGVPPIDPWQPWRISGHATLVLAPQEDHTPRPQEDNVADTRLAMERDQDVHPSIRKARYGG
jgi:maltooligosyltrehalose trehalohydrolase